MSRNSCEITSVASEQCVLEIESYPWQSADAWRPRTSVSLLRTKTGIKVKFVVQDQFVLARTQEFDAPVYEDSCVEFFFTPTPEPGPYFNIEINAAGGLKFNRQASRGIERMVLPSSVRSLINLQVNPGQILNPEHVEPMQWDVSYEVPFALLEEFGPVSRSEWRGNFYKCAEANSHPHFGSWSPIDTPKPDFHRPEFFGRILLQS